MPKNYSTLLFEVQKPDIFSKLLQGSAFLILFLPIILNLITEEYKMTRMFINSIGTYITLYLIITQLNCLLGNLPCGKYSCKAIGQFNGSIFITMFMLIISAMTLSIYYL